MFGSLILVPSFANEISGGVKGFIIGTTVDSSVFAGSFIRINGRCKAPKGACVVEREGRGKANEE